jgi:hypothetical protein
LRKVYNFEDGKLMPASAAVPPDVSEYLETLRVSATHLFGEAKGATIGGTPSQSPGANPFRKETFNLTKQGALVKRNPELARRLKAEAARQS